MSRHHIWKRVNFAPDDVFTLASDICDYPNFIKFISAVRIKSEVLEDQMRILLAEVRIHYQFIRERFSTQVSLNHSQRTVDVKLVRGPFRKLENKWCIHELEDGSSLVEFKVEYELTIPFLSHMLKSKEHRAASSIMKSFERRAAERFEVAGGDEQGVYAQIQSIKSGN